MTEITKIVLTGGPCAGKTSALSFLSESLKKQGVAVFTVCEQATELMKSGKTPESMGSYEFHRLLFQNQLAAEENALLKAKESQTKKTLVLCDRGLLDSRAYVSAIDFARYAAEAGYSEAKLRNRYNAVFHLVTAADGAEEDYTLSNNPSRSENIEQARALDEEILSLWVGAAHLRIIDNRTNFEGKLERLLEETLAVLGIPEPLEIERKFLISYPDIKLLQSLKTCRRVPLTQAYLSTPDEGRFRVRKRGEGEDAVYIKTVKHKINDLMRIEIEDYISKEEYNAYLDRKDCIEGIISKDRYCIAWHGEYFELDVYPFWVDKATLELELLREEQPFELPDFLEVIRDVTMEKAYRNKRLAVIYGNLFWPRK